MGPRSSCHDVQDGGIQDQGAREDARGFVFVFAFAPTSDRHLRPFEDFGTIPSRGHCVRFLLSEHGSRRPFRGGKRPHHGVHPVQNAATLATACDRGRLRSSGAPRRLAPPPLLGSSDLVEGKRFRLSERGSLLCQFRNSRPPRCCKHPNTSSSPTLLRDFGVPDARHLVRSVRGIS